ncbi:Spo11/DNA topoisomerase VI, subunit A [Pseudocohnilembus persalinus]|uniref:Spo11/DNA topoisomerase VI, subunit A n=1 Tax=Pseudocohnilembus persalinus TaxID=266149 RepID=A0A0V0R0E8_PSEPJ|nr:Spo11/DNA topoisomerase VI, subunit A [Pseudocohnilembus persalinus]|eukprot:KRX08009.1 Spo11/DNA topoisomerase VI, subunit A [Pseudocohnilembus persalinus]
MEQNKNRMGLEELQQEQLNKQQSSQNEAEIFKTINLQNSTKPKSLIKQQKYDKENQIFSVVQNKQLSNGNIGSNNINLKKDFSIISQQNNLTEILDNSQNYMSNSKAQSEILFQESNNKNLKDQRKQNKKKQVENGILKQFEYNERDNLLQFSLKSYQEYIEEQKKNPDPEIESSQQNIIQEFTEKLRKITNSTEQKQEIQQLKEQIIKSQNFSQQFQNQSNESISQSQCKTKNQNQKQNLQKEQQQQLEQSNNSSRISSSQIENQSQIGQNSIDSSTISNQEELKQFFQKNSDKPLDKQELDLILKNKEIKNLKNIKGVLENQLIKQFENNLKKEGYYENVIKTLIDFAQQQQEQLQLSQQSQSIYSSQFQQQQQQQVQLQQDVQQNLEYSNPHFLSQQSNLKQQKSNSKNVFNKDNNYQNCNNQQSFLNSTLQKTRSSSQQHQLQQIQLMNIQNQDEIINKNQLALQNTIKGSVSHNNLLSPDISQITKSHVEKHSVSTQNLNNNNITNNNQNNKYFNNNQSNEKQNYNSQICQNLRQQVQNVQIKQLSPTYTRSLSPFQKKLLEIQDTERNQYNNKGYLLNTSEQIEKYGQLQTNESIDSFVLEQNIQKFQNTYNHTSSTCKKEQNAQKSYFRNQAEMWKAKYLESEKKFEIFQEQIKQQFNEEIQRQKEEAAQEIIKLKNEFDNDLGTITNQIQDRVQHSLNEKQQQNLQMKERIINELEDSLRLLEIKLKLSQQQQQSAINDQEIIIETYKRFETNTINNYQKQIEAKDQQINVLEKQIIQILNKLEKQENQSQQQNNQINRQKLSQQEKDCQSKNFNFNSNFTENSSLDDSDKQSNMERALLTSLEDYQQYKNRLVKLQECVQKLEEQKKQHEKIKLKVQYDLNLANLEISKLKNQNKEFSSQNKVLLNQLEISQDNYQRVLKRNKEIEEDQEQQIEKYKAHLADFYQNIKQVPRKNLRVVSAGKGLISGNISFYEGKNFIDLSQNIEFNQKGKQISEFTENINSIKTKALFVLVIEKETVFFHILNEKCQNLLQNAIIITGKGYSDYGTKQLIKKIWYNFPQIPFFYIGDYDLYGFEIFSNYTNGSVKTFQEQNNLPCLFWLGIKEEDVYEDFEAENEQEKQLFNQFINKKDIQILQANNQDKKKYEDLIENCPLNLNIDIIESEIIHESENINQQQQLQTQYKHENKFNNYHKNNLDNSQNNNLFQSQITNQKIEQYVKQQVFQQQQDLLELQKFHLIRIENWKFELQKMKQNKIEIECVISNLKKGKKFSEYILFKIMQGKFI